MTEFFTDIPWEGIAGFLASIGLLAALVGKWTPFLNKLIEGWIEWIGGLFTKQTNNRLDHLSGQFEKHIEDPDAHTRLKNDDLSS